MNSDSAERFVNGVYRVSICIFLGFVGLGCNGKQDAQSDENGTSSTVDAGGATDTAQLDAGTTGGTDSEGAENNNDSAIVPSDTDVEGEAIDPNSYTDEELCVMFIDAHRKCEVLTEGELSCALAKAYTPCEVLCFHTSDCPTLKAYYCQAFYLYCMAQCEADMFTCGSGERISASWECDVDEDCADGSDEHEACQVFSCASGEQVIAAKMECDGTSNCTDGSDEHDACGVFACASGDETVHPDKECNWEDDCSDGSDEHQGCAQLRCE